MYTIIYARSFARKVPQNYILLTLYTIAQSYFVSTVTCRHDPKMVFIAAALTAAITVALTVYAFTTKTDFTMMGGLLFVLGAVLFVATLLSFFFRNRLLQIIISCFTVILFSMYLIYDTQLIVGNGTLMLDVNDYIFAAFNL